MEFPFDINILFPERVTVLDHTLVAGRTSALRPDLQTDIAKVIDELGRSSAKAQKLPGPITSAIKLQAQRHEIYLLKDGESNGGRGAVVGFLKVGSKKLFLLDRQGVHVEAEPLCVLDFYIAESLQRHGYGLELFEFMLQHKDLAPALMAYDRPSPKFLSFLEKRYCLSQSVPQVNNFVVFEGFFHNRSAAQMRKPPLRKTDGEIKPYSLIEREVVGPLSPQRSVSSRSSPSPSRPRPPTAPQSPLTHRSSQQDLAAEGSPNSGQLDSGAVGLLEEIPLQGEETEQTDTQQLVEQTHVQLQPGSPPPSVQPLSASKNDDSLSHASLDSKETHLDTGAEEDLLSSPPQRPAGSMVVTHGQGLEKDGDAGGPSWLWTVGQKCYTAQWVKHKQQYRSTCPW